MVLPGVQMCLPHAMSSRTSCGLQFLCIQHVLHDGAAKTRRLRGDLAEIKQSGLDKKTVCEGTVNKKYISKRIRGTEGLHILVATT